MPSPIEDYALIGDCETAALVAWDGSIDWLCLPRFDSGACFAALLGSPENGRWLLAPAGKWRSTRRYRPDSLILETKFRTVHGSATLIDFMPLRTANPKIIRIVRGDSGRVRMQMDLVIRFDYGFTVPWVTQDRDGTLYAIAGPNRLVLRTNVPLRGKDLHTVAEFEISAGRSAHFELQYSDSYRHLSRGTDPKAALRETEKSWHKWMAQCTYNGPQSAAVRRSLITLKAMIYAPTGGIVAAPTTSLPERAHGRSNWDYRFCWVRDATFALLGFLHAGFLGEAHQWKNWLVRSVAGSAEQLQVMYGPAGERLLREWEVPWLPGYGGARPVRVGNAASEQLQLDLYGELADVLHQSHAAMGRDGSDFDLQIELMEHLRKIWREPDHGIWEIRGPARQYTHSNVMCWVAFDRAIRTAERFHLKAPLQEWRAARREIYDDVCKRGFNARLGSFVQTYGSNEADASLLLMPLVGFLPAQDPRIEGTVRRIEKTLIRDGFVMRFRKDRTQGRRREGAFLPCSFWLADYYLLAGRRSEAQRILGRLLKVCNDVGLLAEEFHVKERRLTGNFPQALSHVALVNTIMNLHAKHGPARQRSGQHRKEIE